MIGYGGYPQIIFCFPYTRVYLLFGKNDARTVGEQMQKVKLFGVRSMDFPRIRT